MKQKDQKHKSHEQGGGVVKLACSVLGASHL